jgi:uncharacterized membrane protein YjjP (DUF1212 family)
MVAALALGAGVWFLIQGDWLTAVVCAVIALAAYRWPKKISGAS